MSVKSIKEKPDFNYEIYENIENFKYHIAEIEAEDRTRIIKSVLRLNSSLKLEDLITRRILLYL
ncbi:MAG: hypothetical protein GF364_16055 [Candidatus Lokiarchaeota archaeon]|nr:hypothetical protein [Candidatus Lokiarchaeota archaeon]